MGIKSFRVSVSVPWLMCDMGSLASISFQTVSFVRIIGCGHRIKCHDKGRLLTLLASKFAIRSSGIKISTNSNKRIKSAYSKYLYKIENEDIEGVSNDCQ